MGEGSKAVPAAGKGRARKVIFADFATSKFGGVIQSLADVDIATESVTEVTRLIERIAEEHFDICVVNLLLGGIGPFELIQNIRKSSAYRDVKIIVVTRQVHKLNIQNTIRAGANDFIAEPFETLNLYHRILYHLGPVKVIEPLTNDKSAPNVDTLPLIKLMLEAAELLSRTERDKMHAAFLKILQDIAGYIGSNRTSLVIVDEPANAGVVLATSDDPKFHNFAISLDKYPEILHVVHTGSLIFVEDVSQNALTERIKNDVRSISIGSLMVFPVCFQSEIVGVLNIRRPEATEIPPMDTMRILQATANIMAAYSNIAALLRRIYKGYTAKAAS